MEQWIKANPPGFGDGWHSYTLSLRCRNWIWLLNFCPSLLNKKICDSLWDQLSWLKVHVEFCHGGNHLLENLISLVMGSLHFKSKDAIKMYNFALKKLKKELNEQILSDGGHEERSASYHIQILDRLIELYILIEIKNISSTEWLIEHISKMIIWTEKAKTLDNCLPKFNDNNYPSKEHIENILDFGE